MRSPWAVVFVLLVAIVSLSPKAQTPLALPIGYVSPNRLIAETADGKNATARMQSFQQQKTGELRALQEKLEATRRQLAQATDSDARAKLQVQEMQDRVSAERGTAQIQIELQNFQRQSQTELQGKIKPIIDELARTRNLQLVLNSDTALAFGTPAADLTPVVIERLNAGAKP